LQGDDIAAAAHGLTTAYVRGAPRPATGAAHLHSCNTLQVEVDLSRSGTTVQNTGACRTNGNDIARIPAEQPELSNFKSALQTGTAKGMSVQEVQAVEVQMLHLQQLPGLAGCNHSSAHKTSKMQCPADQFDQDQAELQRRLQVAELKVNAIT